MLSARPIRSLPVISQLLFPKHIRPVGTSTPSPVLVSSPRHIWCGGGVGGEKSFLQPSQGKDALPENLRRQSSKSAGKKTGGGGGGNSRKGGRELDDLDDDDDDDDDDEADRRRRAAAATAGESSDQLVFDSPVAKFIHEVQRKKKPDTKAAKSKGKSSHHQAVTYEEVKALVEVDHYWSDMEQQIEAMKQHFIHHLTVRSATALDDLPVELEGDKYLLHELASISKKDPKRIVIDCSSFPQATSSVVKTIQSSGMNLNPQQEGTRIFVPIPKVTKEFREKLAKGAKTKFNDARDEMRKVQGKYISRLNDRELKHEGPKDQFHTVRDVLMAINDNFVKEAEEIMLHKQQELMGGGGGVK